MTISKAAAATATVVTTKTNSKKKGKVQLNKAGTAVSTQTITTSTSTNSKGKSGTVTTTKESKNPGTNNSSTSALPPNVANKIDRTLIEKAVTALLKHHTEVTEKDISAKGKLPLLDSQNVVPIQVQFGLEVPPSQQKIKPIRIYIPHSIYQLSSSSSDNNDGTSKKEDYSVDEAEICLIVKDDSTKANVIEMKEQFPQYMKNISKVITLPSLRAKYSEYSQRRLLLSQYTHFIADDRILPMLTSALGKDFITAKKQPIPISMTRKTVLPHAIQNAILHATYLFIPDGTCITIRAAYTCQTITQIVDNIIAVMVHVPTKIVRAWANIKNINIKLPTSIALPVYNQTPSELIEIAQMAGIPSIWVNEDDMKTPVLNHNKGDVQKNQKLSQQIDKDTTSTDATSTTKAGTKKSPLLKAIAKQKKEETNWNLDPLINNKDTKSKKKRKSQLDVVTTTTTSTSTSSSNEDKDITTTKTLPKTKKPVDDKTSPSPSKKIKTTTTVVDDTSSKKTNKDIKTSKDNQPSPEPKAFIAAKKFQGPKTGYVFQIGKSGLGYYIDQPPKVIPRSTTSTNNRRSTISPGRANHNNAKNNNNNNNKKQRRSR